MPHPVSEPAGLAIANLFEVLKHSEFIDSVEERKAVLEKLCGETEAELHKAQEALKPVKAECDKVKMDLDAKNRIIDDLRAKSLFCRC
jgi:phage shock protein A